MAVSNVLPVMAVVKAVKRVTEKVNTARLVAIRANVIPVTAAGIAICAMVREEKNAPGACQNPATAANV